jgi:hypothetical protein
MILFYILTRAKFTSVNFLPSISKPMIIQTLAPAFSKSLGAAIGARFDRVPPGAPTACGCASRACASRLGAGGSVRQKRRMKVRHAGALSLVGWYLMVPPRIARIRTLAAELGQYPQL